MTAPQVPGRFDELFRQVTPLFLLVLLAVVVFEPYVPGTAWLRANLGETVVLRLCTAALGLYVLLLWGESLRLNTVLTGVLRAFREHAGGAGAPGEPSGKRNPRARLEAAKLLIAALRSEDPEIRRTSHHNLQRLVGEDLGVDPEPWLDWVAAQAERQS